MTGREVDLLVTHEGKPWLAVEARLGDRAISRPLVAFRERLAIPHCFQVLAEPDVDLEKQGVRVISAARFLAALA